MFNNFKIQFKNELTFGQIKEVINFLEKLTFEFTQIGSTPLLYYSKKTYNGEEGSYKIDIILSTIIISLVK